jgi:ABC-type multidrug transport system ATPase subunit
VEIGGEPINSYDIRSKSAFIAQEFAMLPKLTTLETLNVAANLKLPTKVPDMQKRKIINNIVSMLGIESCLHTHVGQLSGGEKKRLSIGVELITNPPLMLFDEPTR